MAVRKKIAIIPTLCTLGNACCGFASIYFASHFTERVTLQTAIYVSGWLILLAMVFDALDGYLARLSKSASDFGTQLDSLCDAISFGLAPAFLLIRLGYEAQFDQHRLMWNALLVIAAIYMSCAILRLARFNVQTTIDPKSHRYFRGLPSPAAAGCVATLAIVRYNPDNPWFTDVFMLNDTAGRVIDWLAPLATLTVALLMVSRFTYIHFANQILHRRRSFRRFVQLGVLVVVATVFLQELAVLLGFWLYAAIGPVRHGWNKLLRRETLPPEETPVMAPPSPPLSVTSDVHRPG